MSAATKRRDANNPLTIANQLRAASVVIAASAARTFSDEMATSGAAASIRFSDIEARLEALK